jgi:hypothetical protein
MSVRPGDGSCRLRSSFIALVVAFIILLARPDL